MVSSWKTYNESSNINISVQASSALTSLFTARIANFLIYSVHLAHIFGYHFSLGGSVLISVFIYMTLQLDLKCVTFSLANV